MHQPLEGHEITNLNTKAAFVRCRCGKKIELSLEEIKDLSQEKIADILLDAHAAHTAAKAQR